ncbi:hypothetical protein KM043_001281 [Ampulex compressa]|nr:hypothetical protein KM043_001281 [Ampulex compressa]
MWRRDDKPFRFKGPACEGVDCGSARTTGSEGNDSRLLVPPGYTGKKNQEKKEKEPTKLQGSRVKSLSVQGFKVPRVVENGRGKRVVISCEYFEEGKGAFEGVEATWPGACGGGSSKKLVPGEHRDSLAGNDGQ